MSSGKDWTIHDPFYFFISRSIFTVGHHRSREIRPAYFYIKYQRKYNGWTTLISLDTIINFHRKSETPVFFYNFIIIGFSMKLIDGLQAVRREIFFINCRLGAHAWTPVTQRIIGRLNSYSFYCCFCRPMSLCWSTVSIPSSGNRNGKTDRTTVDRVTASDP